MSTAAKYSLALVFALSPLTPAYAASRVPVVVEGTPQLAPNRYLLMQGYGVVRAMPDTAVIAGGVITRARHAGDALHANSQAMAKVVAALKTLGITDAEITTSSFSFEPQYETDSKGNIDPDRHITAYSVSNRVTVTLTAKLEQAGDVLDALISNGADDSTAISFELRDRQALEMKAREVAGKDALMRAQTYARAIGAELGAVRSVREGYFSGGRDDDSVEVTGARAAFAPAPPPPPTRVQAGEQAISQSVTVVWALK